MRPRRPVVLGLVSALVLTGGLAAVVASRDGGPGDEPPADERPAAVPTATPTAGPGAGPTPTRGSAAPGADLSADPDGELGWSASLAPDPAGGGVVVRDDSGRTLVAQPVPWAATLTGAEEFVTDASGTSVAVLPRVGGGQGAVVIAVEDGEVRDFGSLAGRFQAPTAIDVRGSDEGHAVLVLQDATVAPAPESGGLVMALWTWQDGDYVLTGCRLVVPQSFQEVDYPPVDGSCATLPADWASAG